MKHLLCLLAVLTMTAGLFLPVMAEGTGVPAVPAITETEPADKNEIPPVPAQPYFPEEEAAAEQESKPSAKNQADPVPAKSVSDTKSTSNMLLGAGKSNDTFSLTASTDELWVREQYELQISAETANSVDLYCTYVGQNGAGNEHLYTSWSSGYSGTLSYTASNYTQVIWRLVGHYDGGDREAAVTINVQSLGTLDSPSVTISSNQLQSGDTLNYSFTAVDNAESYNAYITHEKSSGGSEWITDNTVTSAGSYSFKTTGWEDGTYYLHVRAQANKYFDGYSHNNIFWIGEADTSVTLTAENTQVVTSEQIRLQIHAPAASRVELWRKDGNNGTDHKFTYWDYGIDTTISFQADDAGTITFKTKALVNDTWVESDPVTVTVTAPNGKLDIPALTIPSPISPNTDFTVTFTSVQHAEKYEAVLFRTEDGYS